MCLTQSLRIYHMRKQFNNRNYPPIPVFSSNNIYSGWSVQNPRLNMEQLSSTMRNLTLTYSTPSNDANREPEIPEQTPTAPHLQFQQKMENSVQSHRVKIQHMIDTENKLSKFMKKCTNSDSWLLSTIRKHPRQHRNSHARPRPHI